MSLRGNNFFHMVEIGQAIPPQVVSTVTTINGTAIVEPWKTGRQISFLANFGDIAATASATLKVQGRLRSDGTTWQDVQVAATDLAFTAADIADGGASESTVVIGTLDLNVFDGETYEAIRLEFDNLVAVAVPIGVSYVISDLYTHPGSLVDQIFDTQRNAPAA